MADCYYFIALPVIYSCHSVGGLGICIYANVRIEANFTLEGGIFQPPARGACYGEGRTLSGRGNIPAPLPLVHAMRYGLGKGKGELYQGGGIFQPPCSWCML